MSATTAFSGPIVGTIVDALEDVVSGVPASREVAVPSPATAARALARKAAARAAGLSGALALPPGLFGMLTVLPDLVAIWRIQAQMVADIAGLYGRDLQLTRSHMVYCLFRHAATQFTRDVVVRAGQRLVVRQLSGGAIKSMLTSVGVPQPNFTMGPIRNLPSAGGKKPRRSLMILGAFAMMSFGNITDSIAPLRIPSASACNFIVRLSPNRPPTASSVNPNPS
jgi:uncharacterized protein (DUF697 family)